MPAGLITVGEGGHSLASVTNALHTVHQCSPLTDSLYLVTNTQNHDEYAGAAGFFDDIGRFSRGWQASHTFCNGCSKPEEWQGHAADLLMAMRRIAEEGGPTAGLDTIAIDANLFMWPKFNLQVRWQPLQTEQPHGCARQAVFSGSSHLLAILPAFFSAASTALLPHGQQAWLQIGTKKHPLNVSASQLTGSHRSCQYGTGFRLPFMPTRSPHL